jgi:hypothetical protein
VERLLKDICGTIKEFVVWRSLFGAAGKLRINFRSEIFQWRGWIKMEVCAFFSNDFAKREG